MSQFDAFARFYDADYGAFVDDLAFYGELARRTGGPILELMCGSGRVLRPLAQAGYQVVGVDVSPALLELARQALADAGLLRRATLVEADVRAELSTGPFALALCAVNSFTHLETAEDQLAALQRVHAVLAPGGLLVLDLANPDPRELLRHDDELVLDKTFQLVDGTSVQKFVAQSVDMAEQQNHVTFLYDEIGSDGLVRRATLPFTTRWLYRFELEHLLARAGFVLEAVYGSYDLDDYDADSPLLLVVAQRA